MLLTFDMDRMAVVFGDSGGGTVRQMGSARLLILRDGARFERKMRRAASFI